MSPFLRLMLGASFMCAAQSAAAANAACPVSDKEFLHQITSSSDWLDVHAVFKRNLPACPDDGLYADGYTNMVVGMLAANWGEVDRLDELVAQDAAFRQFVLRHIGISAGEADLRRVLRSAQADCPKKSARLCKELAARSKRALGARK